MNNENLRNEAKPKIRLIVSMHGGTVQEVMIDSSDVEITDVVFLEDGKYLEDSDRFEVESGPMAGQFIYTHHGPIDVAGPDTFDPVMKAAQARIDACEDEGAKEDPS